MNYILNCQQRDYSNPLRNITILLNVIRLPLRPVDDRLYKVRLHDLP